MSGAVIVLGVGMHPWGKWRRNFVDYGVHAARAALADAAVDWRDIQFISGAATMRWGYPGYVAGATIAHALGWQGAEANTSFAACASGAHALAAARAKILAGDCDLALVVGADATHGGLLAPAAGHRPEDPDWMRFRLGLANPAYLALWARRRMHLYGATVEDFARVRIKNAEHGVHNPHARYRMRLTMSEVLNSTLIADPLRLFHICSVADGGAAVVLASEAYAAKVARKQVRITAISTMTPQHQTTTPEMPFVAVNLSVAEDAPSHAASLARQAYERAGVGPEDLSVAEVYDLSSALELDWYEHLGLCPRSEAEQLLRSGATAIGGRIPVNPSGGLACMGEVVAAQALAQICELTWQLRGACGSRQIPGARAAIAATAGVFGHGSCTVLVR